MTENICYKELKEKLLSNVLKYPIYIKQCWRKDHWKLYEQYLKMEVDNPGHQIIS